MSVVYRLALHVTQPFRLFDCFGLMALRSPFATCAALLFRAFFFAASALLLRTCLAGAALGDGSGLRRRKAVGDGMTMASAIKACRTREKLRRLVDLQRN